MVVAVRRSKSCSFLPSEVIQRQNKLAHITTHFSGEKKMKNLFFTFVIAGIALLVPTQAQAVFIVDTGPGPARSSSLFIGNEPGILNRAFAGKFITTQDYTVTSIQNWMMDNDEFTSLTRNIDAVIYADNNGSVDTSVEIFRQTFVGPADVPQNSPIGADWYGPSGLNFKLLSGTYWVAIEVINPHDFVGLLTTPVPSPLTDYAVDLNGSGLYSENLPSQFTWGYRIDALESNPNAVPEPATMVLFASGLVGAGFRKRLKV